MLIGHGKQIIEIVYHYECTLIVFQVGGDSASISPMPLECGLTLSGFARGFLWSLQARPPSVPSSQLFCPLSLF
ncbi:MAG: hypothetical protein WBG92_14330, partial [Thiohalocapsa sp.]